MLQSRRTPQPGRCDSEPAHIRLFKGALVTTAAGWLTVPLWKSTAVPDGVLAESMLNGTAIVHGSAGMARARPFAVAQ